MGDKPNPELHSEWQDALTSEQLVAKIEELSEIVAVCDRQLPELTAERDRAATDVELMIAAGGDPVSQEEILSQANAEIDRHTRYRDESAATLAGVRRLLAERQEQEKRERFRGHERDAAAALRRRNRAIDEFRATMAKAEAALAAIVKAEADAEQALRAAGRIDDIKRLRDTPRRDRALRATVFEDAPELFAILGLERKMAQIMLRGLENALYSPLNIAALEGDDNERAAA